MEINKISVGAESIVNPIGINVEARPKAVWLRDFTLTLFNKLKAGTRKLTFFSGNLLKRIYYFIKFGLKSRMGRLRNRETVTMNDGKLRMRNTKKIKKAGLLTLALIALIGIAVVTKVKFVNTGKNSSGSTLGNKITVNDALETLYVTREFQFPVRDAKGNEVTKLKYFIDKAEMRDEIIVQGKKATAVRGREFLIVYLKLTNEYSQKLDINTRNYIRLSVNGNEDEWLAPDIHNDPVEVQAQSTKVTRLGFPLNASDTKLILRVGEIDGDKEKVEINF